MRCPAGPGKKKQGSGQTDPAYGSIKTGCARTRAHAHWIVTEYGAVNLYGKALRERARLLISIAHPDDRARLYDAATKRYGPSFKYLS